MTFYTAIQHNDGNALFLHMMDKCFIVFALTHEQNAIVALFMNGCVIVKVVNSSYKEIIILCHDAVDTF